MFRKSSIQLIETPVLLALLILTLVNSFSSSSGISSTVTAAGIETIRTSTVNHGEKQISIKGPGGSVDSHLKNSNSNKVKLNNTVNTLKTINQKYPSLHSLTEVSTKSVSNPGLSLRIPSQQKGLLQQVAEAQVATTKYGNFSVSTIRDQKQQYFRSRGDDTDSYGDGDSEEEVDDIDEEDVEDIEDANYFDDDEDAGPSGEDSAETESDELVIYLHSPSEEVEAAKASANGSSKSSIEIDVENRQFSMYLFQGQYISEPRLNPFIEGAMRNLARELRQDVMDPVYFRVLPRGRVESRAKPVRTVNNGRRKREAGHDDEDTGTGAKLGTEQTPRLFGSFKKTLKRVLLPSKKRIANKVRRTKNKLKGRKPGLRQRIRKRKPNYININVKAKRKTKNNRNNNWKKVVRKGNNRRKVLNNKKNNRVIIRNRVRFPATTANNNVKNQNIIRNQIKQNLKNAQKRLKSKRQKRNRKQSRNVGGGRVEGLSRIACDGDAEMQLFGNYTLIRSHMKLGPLELSMQFKTRRGLRRTGATLPAIRMHTVTRLNKDGSEMIDFLLERPHAESIHVRGNLFPLAKRIARNIFARLFVPNSFLTSRIREKAALALLSKPRLYK